MRFAIRGIPRLYWVPKVYEGALFYPGDYPPAPAKQGATEHAKVLGVTPCYLATFGTFGISEIP